MKKNLREALKNLVAAEAAILGAEFLAPVARGRGVTVKIAGVICTMAATPENFHGWGLFRVESHTRATLIRKATEKERQHYLRLFPAIQLIVCSIDRNTAQATPANPSDTRFHATGPVTIQLCGQLELFDTVVARFDSSQFWFEQIDPRAESATAAYLRRELTKMIDPKKIARPNLTGGQRFAYTFEFARRAAVLLADQRRGADARLAEALRHAGGMLSDFSEAQDVYRVTFTVDGRCHISVVRRDDLTVQSAGICLSGQDRDFDLSSLVGVLREGAAMGRVPPR